MKAKSIKGYSPSIIKTELEQSMADGFKPTLAIVFLSIKQDIEAITGLLDENGIKIFGATTAGEFIDGDIEEGSIVIVLLDMDPAYFKLAFIEIDPENALEDAKKLGVIGKETFNNPAFIVATGGVFIDGDQIMDGITQGFGKPASSAERELTIFGGMAGDDLIAEKPLVFINGACKDNALIALIIDEDRIDVRGIATCGWKAIGTAKTVTKSEGNIVYTIDDKLALDMLMKYLGVDVQQEDNNGVVAFLNSWYYPLQLERENGDIVIRATRFANSDNRSLICTGSVPQGSKIKFAFPPKFDAIETVVGFFTYGEYGRSKIGNNEFHNNACCVVALKEK